MVQNNFAYESLPAVLALNGNSDSISLSPACWHKTSSGKFCVPLLNNMSNWKHRIRSSHDLERSCMSFPQAQNEELGDSLPKLLCRKKVVTKFVSWQYGSRNLFSKKSIFLLFSSNGAVLAQNSEGSSVITWSREGRSKSKWRTICSFFSARWILGKLKLMSSKADSLNH